MRSRYAAVGIAVGLVALSSVGHFSGQPRPRPEPAASLKVEKVENGGLLFTDNPAGVSGVDGGYSLPIGNQSLWLFGDVFLLHPNRPEKPYVGAVSNCALLLPKGKGVTPLRRYTFLTDAKTGLARQVIPRMGGEGTDTLLWPFGSWYDAPNRRVYLYYAIVRATGSGGPFGFRVVGQGLARADVGEPKKLQFTRLKAPQNGWLWWPGSETLFGSAVVSNRPESDPYLYLVGFQERGGQKAGKMARVRKQEIENPAAYEYFAGGADTPRWSRILSEAADIAGLTDFPSELSIAYNAYCGGYLAVHSVNIEERLRLSVAPNPWGPYRPIGEVGAKHRAFDNAFCYAGKEHPELSEQNGRILYVTYVDSARYWLQLLKVTLSR